MITLDQERAREAFDTHRPAAMALDAAQVLSFRLDVDLAVLNVMHAMRVIDRYGPDVPAHLPNIVMAELESLPSLALAVKMSALIVQHTIPADMPVSEVIAEGWRLRAQLLPAVAGLVAAGLVPKAVYDKIHQGKGVRDMAEDNVSLAQVFYDYEATIAGKHAVDPDTIVRAEKVGSWLVQRLRKRTAPRQRAQRTPELDVRDRLATLLVQRYARLRAVAHYFLLDEYGEHAPPLMSRSVVRPPASNDDDAPASDTPASQTPPSSTGGTSSTAA